MRVRAPFERMIEEWDKQNTEMQLRDYYKNYVTWCVAEQENPLLHDFFYYMLGRYLDSVSAIWAEDSPYRRYTKSPSDMAREQIHEPLPEPGEEAAIFKSKQKLI